MQVESKTIQANSVARQTWVYKLFATVATLLLALMPITPARASDGFEDNAELTALMQASEERMEHYGVVMSTKMWLFGEIDTVYNPRVESFPVNVATVAPRWKLADFARFYSANDNPRLVASTFQTETQNSFWIDSVQNILFPGTFEIAIGGEFDGMVGSNMQGAPGTIESYSLEKVGQNFRAICVTLSYDELEPDLEVYTRYQVDVVVSSGLVTKIIRSTQTAEDSSFEFAVEPSVVDISYNYNVVGIKAKWNQALKLGFNSKLDTSTMEYALAINKAITKSEQHANKTGFTINNSNGSDTSFSVYDSKTKKFVSGTYADVLKTKMVELSFDWGPNDFLNIWQYFFAENTFLDNSITFNKETGVYKATNAFGESFSISVTPNGYIHHAEVTEPDPFSEDPSTEPVIQVYDIKYSTSPAAAKKWLKLSAPVESLATNAVACQSWGEATGSKTEFVVGKKEMVCNLIGDYPYDQNYPYTGKENQAAAIKALNLVKIKFTKKDS